MLGRHVYSKPSASARFDSKDPSMTSPGYIHDLQKRLDGLIAKLDYSKTEQKHLVELMQLFLSLPCPDDPYGLYPHYQELYGDFLEHAGGADAEGLEESFLNLYCHLHGHEAPYTQSERDCVTKTGGYWCHAGGISPILKAGPYIHTSTVSGDFGAGNGLQGLLLQKLYPHAKTIQIEISSRMVQAGRRLQRWLGIEDRRIEWICADVLESTSKNMDFIYLYRPVRPEGRGRTFYTRIASELSAAQRPIVVFSIADCLSEFLPESFEMFYTDGHLTCFHNHKAIG